MYVKQARLAGIVDMRHRFARAKNAKNRIVETFGPFDIIRTDHYVIEHVLCLLS